MNAGDLHGKTEKEKTRNVAVLGGAAILLASRRFPLAKAVNWVRLWARRRCMVLFHLLLTTPPALTGSVSTTERGLLTELSLTESMSLMADIFFGRYLCQPMSCDVQVAQLGYPTRWCSPHEVEPGAESSR